MGVNVKPLHDRVLVQPMEAKETVKGGIIIPDSAKEKPQEGTVIAVGEGKIMEDGSRRPMAVKKGDKVIYSKYAGSEIKVEDTEYLLMREDDILGIVE
ncbi:MAG: co-chaperone GroES [Candidatus Nitrospinota bacterium M3_3B_026]